MNESSLHKAAFRSSKIRMVMAGLASVAALSLMAEIGRADPTPSSPKVEKTCSGAGTVWWNELRAADPDRAIEFYAKVMGWSPKVVALNDHARAPQPHEQRYTLFMASGRESAGLMKSEDPSSTSQRPGWFVYMQVDNVDSAVAATLAHGGKLIEGPFVVPGTGKMAVIQDPFGTPVGLVTPAEGSPC